MIEVHQNVATVELLVGIFWFWLFIYAFKWLVLYRLTDSVAVPSFHLRNSSWDFEVVLFGFDSRLFDLELVCTPGLIWNFLSLFPLFFKLKGTLGHHKYHRVAHFFNTSWHTFLNVIYTQSFSSNFLSLFSCSSFRKKNFPHSTFPSQPLG